MNDLELKKFGTLRNIVIDDGIMRYFVSFMIFRDGIWHIRPDTEERVKRLSNKIANRMQMGGYNWSDKNVEDFITLLCSKEQFPGQLNSTT